MTPQLGPLKARSPSNQVHPDTLHLSRLERRLRCAACAFSVLHWRLQKTLSVRYLLCRVGPRPVHLREELVMRKALCMAAVAIPSLFLLWWLQVRGHFKALETTKA